MERIGWRHARRGVAVDSTDLSVHRSAWTCSIHVTNEWLLLWLLGVGACIAAYPACTSSSTWTSSTHGHLLTVIDSVRQLLLLLLLKCSPNPL
jgi:hypothetical protein